MRQTRASDEKEDRNIWCKIMKKQEMHGKRYGICVCVCGGGGGGGAETDGQNISLKQGGDRHGLGVHLTKKLNDKSSNFSVSSQSHSITSGQSNSVISKCLLQSQSLHFKVSPYTCI